MHSLLLSQRPTLGEAYVGDITHIARGWRRSSRAVGGYWTGSFGIDASQMGRSQMSDFYERYLGCIVREYCAGLLSWEGYICEMRLVMDGFEHMRSLLPEHWHNKVAVFYSAMSSVDSQQGNLSYDPGSPLDSFQDDAQDFSDWQTTSGSAAYRIVVVQTGADDKDQWGFLGATFTTTNTNDSIYVYEDEELTDEGWASSGRTTPSTYTIEPVEGAGTPQSTSWSTNADSIAEYGQMEYLETLGSLPPETAEVLRDRHLTQFAWPRSQLVGGGTLGERRLEDRLVVAVAGFFHTLNWRYRSTSRIANGSDLITTLVGESEFVTAGRIEANGISAKADCDPVPQRLGDLCEDVINVGDLEGNIWQGGVYGDRKFRYEQAPTSVDYHLRGPYLTDKAGVRILAPLVEPGFLVRISGAMLAGQPPGTSSLWDDPQVAYVDEVEFMAPDQLRLKLFGEVGSIITLMEQIRIIGVGDASPE